MTEQTKNFIFLNIESEFFPLIYQNQKVLEKTGKEYQKLETGKNLDVKMYIVDNHEIIKNPRLEEIFQL